MLGGGGGDKGGFISTADKMNRYIEYDKFSVGEKNEIGISYAYELAQLMHVCAFSAINNAVHTCAYDILRLNSRAHYQKGTDLGPIY